jgi:cytochrome c-type protein NapC
MQLPSSVLAWASLLGIAGAAAILLRQLVLSPPLHLRTKLLLALGLAVLPLFAAVTTTVEGMQRTTERDFCGSCHVMQAHVADAEDPASLSLASRHARNPFFGSRNCYVCHANYGLIGYPMTKLNGMKHVYHYYLGEYGELSLEQALPKLHLYEPYDNVNCRQCHSGLAPLWKEVPEHAALGEALFEGSVSCASGGCHGYAHPFSKGLAGTGDAAGDGP